MSVLQEEFTGMERRLHLAESEATKLLTLLDEVGVYFLKAWVVYFLKAWVCFCIMQGRGVSCKEGGLLQFSIAGALRFASEDCRLASQGERLAGRC